MTPRPVRSAPWRRVITIMITGLALVLPTSGLAAAQPDGRHGDRFPKAFDLPVGFQPEGIAIGPGPVAFLGSRVNGDIYAADLRTGTGRIISRGPGAGNPSLGLKSDQRRLLYVSGGTTGSGRIVDFRSGAIVADYRFTNKTSFVNDVVLARGKAWFTDSRQAQLYVVPQAKHGKPAPASAVRTLPLSGDWKQDTTPNVNNANGIAVSPDGRSLLVVQSNTGLLFRVDPKSGRARTVDLGGRLLTNGDGLLVRGRTLYAVQNRSNLISVYTLDRSGRSGRFVKQLTSDLFDVPSTVAAYKNRLYLPNARFTTPPTPTTEYQVTSVKAR